MKKLLLGVATLAVALLSLTACRQDSTTAGGEVPQPTPPATEVMPAKIVLTLSNGHLHGRKNFHFVPSGGVFRYQDIYNAQTFTFVRHGDTWQLDPKSLQRFIGYKTHYYTPGDADSGAPDYGATLRLYDAEGKLINDAFATEGKRESYQFFSSLSEGKDWEGNAIATAEGDQPQLLNYVYCDTNIWDKSASKSPKDANGRSLYHFLPDTEPLGIKGYYQFLRLGEYTLHIDLWQTPAGKLEGGKPSPFYAPNATVRQGKRLLRLQLPALIFAEQAFYDEIIEAIEEDFEDQIKEAKTNEEREKLQRRPLSWEKTPESLRPVAERLIRLLGADSWTTVQGDFLQHYLNKGNESSTDGYF